MKYLIILLIIAIATGMAYSAVTSTTGAGSVVTDATGSGRIFKLYYVTWDAGGDVMTWDSSGDKILWE